MSTISSSQVLSVSVHAKTMQRLAIGLAIVAFLLTRVYLLLFFSPRYSDIVPVYFPYAVKGVDQKLCPYRDFGVEHSDAGPNDAIETIEYPPGAWWVIAAPRLLSTRPVVTELDKKHVLLSYYVSYRWLMFAADVGIFVLFAAILKRRRPEFLAWGLWSYVVTSTILGHVLYDRLDIVLLLLLALWSYAWLRSDDSDGLAPLWRWASYFVLGFGIAYKLVPLVAVPFAIFADWRVTKKFYHKILSSVASLLMLAAGALLPGIPFYREVGSGVLGFLKFHSQRPVEIESLYASLMMLLAPLGLRIEPKFGYGGWNLDSSIAPPLAAMSTWIGLAALCGLALWAFVRRRDFDRPAAWRMACFGILVTMVTAKVLSVQYLIWAIPLIIWLGAEVLTEREFAGLCGLSTLAALLTTWVFPYHFFDSVTPYALTPILHPLACGVLIARNLVLLGVVAWLGVRMVQVMLQRRNPRAWS